MLTGGTCTYMYLAITCAPGYINDDIVVKPYVPFIFSVSVFVSTGSYNPSSTGDPTITTGDPAITDG